MPNCKCSSKEFCDECWPRCVHKRWVGFCNECCICGKYDGLDCVARYDICKNKKR